MRTRPTVAILAAQDERRAQLWRMAAALLLALALILSSALVTQAQGAEHFPEVIPVPNGFAPEGIATGRGTDFYVGSLVSGAVYKGDLRTGEGAVLVPPQEGRIAVGMYLDKRTNYLFVAGGPTGAAYVYDGTSGANVADYQLVPGGGFVNDVVVTRQAAYFTDSFRPYLYKVPLLADGTPSGPATEIELTGDFEFVPNAFNANGIDATSNDKELMVINSFTGILYWVHPDTGVATSIDLGGVALTSGDGILLRDKTVYVMRNRLNQIAVVQLDPKGLTGQVVDTLTSPYFDVPTTIADFGSWIYAVNARFGTPVTPDTGYDVVQVER